VLDVLIPIAGDPYEVASTGRTLASIANDVAHSAARLRALASGTAGWTGTAAIAAHARTATLPTKLDKVDASYAAAASALLTYASMLADAQQRSQTAISTAVRANADLQTAEAAHRSAAAADAQATAAAHAAGRPPPPPYAPRFEASIADASARYQRAATQSTTAQDDALHAAGVAARALQQASHEGIHNASWWQHVTHAVSHWTASHWAQTLGRLSKLAGTISALATVAALALAIGGMFFPPLEAAAALAQGVATVSGLIATTSALIVHLTDKRTRNDGFLSLAALVVPSAARRITRLMPMGSAHGVLTAVEHTPPTHTVTREIPLGFSSREDFKTFGVKMRTGLDEAGYPNTVPVMQGSAVTGVKHTTGAPFDEGRVSDFDIALAGPDITAAAHAAGVPFRNGGLRSVPLGENHLEALGLANLRDGAKSTRERPVFFMIYRSEQDALTHKPSIRVLP
jgi:hypothetical protein